jgi:CHASE2 domain-containing sensor protein
MCFGGRSHIWGIVIGLFIITIGVSSLLGGNIWDKIWPAFIILVGLIIVANAVMRRS